MPQANDAERQPAKVTAPTLPGLNTLVGIVTAVVVVAGLYLAREVLIPITLAILLSFVLAPLVTLLRRVHVPHVLSVLVAVVLGLGLLGAVGSIIGLQVAGLAADVPQYANTIEQKIGAVRSATVGRIGQLTSVIERQVERTTSPPPVAPDAQAPAAPEPKLMQVEVHQPALGPLELAHRALEPILSRWRARSSSSSWRSSSSCRRRTCAIVSSGWSAPAIFTGPPRPWTMRPSG